MNINGQVVITTFLDYNQSAVAWKNLENSIAYDEFGRLISSSTKQAWTGMDNNGNALTTDNGVNYTGNCKGFTHGSIHYNPAHNSGSASANAGQIDQTSGWYYNSSMPCYERNRLICVET